MSRAARVLGAWRGRCRCWFDDGGLYGLDAHQCAAGCPQHGPCGCGKP